jgi:enolase
MLSIQNVRALEILDSRGNPTISVTVELSDGTRATAQVPSGASTGKHEAVELRDRDAARFAGKGVLIAVANVNDVLGPAIRGLGVEDQAALDRRLIEIDGTPDKSRLGANALLGISCACARAWAQSRRVPLWRSLPSGQTPKMPVPMVNIISGGLHAGSRIEVQDFLVIPSGFPDLATALEGIVKVHRAAEGVLLERCYKLTGVADEGGWGPSLESNQEGLDILADAIARTGIDEHFSIALDIAASHFHEDGRYHLKTENRTLTAGEMIQLLSNWTSTYPITSIEDGLEEDDWHGWRSLTEKMGSRVQLVGDDLFTTNPERVRYGISIGVANAVLVKMNQIGTLTETFEVVRIAREAGYSAVISARSGETEDSFLADLAVACGTGQIKIGSVTRSERLSKYNRLLEIERDFDKSL